MKKNDKYFSWISLVLTFSTGITIWIIKEFFQIETEFGLRQNPNLSFFQMLHHLSIPLSCILLGLLWRSHLATHLKKNKYKIKEKTGVAILALLTITIFSGQWQLSISDRATLDNVSLIHLISGIAVFCVFLVHHFLKSSR